MHARCRLGFERESMLPFLVRPLGPKRVVTEGSSRVRKETRWRATCGETQPTTKAKALGDWANARHRNQASAGFVFLCDLLDPGICFLDAHDELI
jgi:hypothetical protein